MANRTVLSVRLDTQQAKHERVPERLEACVKNTGRPGSAIGLEAIRQYLDALDKPAPIPALTEAVNRLNETSISMFETVSAGILSNRQRANEAEKWVLAVIHCLDEETQKAVADKWVRLMKAQDASDKQIAGYEELEKRGTKTPLSVAARNLKASQESHRSRENPLEN